MLLAVVNLLLFWGIVYGNGYDCNIDNPSIDKAIASLKAQGYEIEEGYVEWYFNKSSYGANPELVYGLYNFERVELEIQKQHQHTKQINISIRPHQNVSNFWFSYGTTALLWYGCLPPAKYYSYRSYVNRRYNPSNITNFTQKKYFPEMDPYGSLGDMLNMDVWNFSMYNNDVYNRQSVVISTGDATSYNDIYGALSDANIPNLSSMTNLDTIPIEWVQYKKKDWYGQLLNGGTIDSFGIMLRAYHLPTYPYTNQTKYDNYFRNDVWNQTVYKISAKQYENITHPRKAYHTYERYNVNQTTIIPNEQDILQPYFTKYVTEIIDFMLSINAPNNKYQYRSTKIGSPLYKGKYDYGFACIEWGTHCLADNRDSMYFITYPDVSILGNDTIQFFVGVNHADTNVCSWGNIVPYFPQDGIVQDITHHDYRARGMWLSDYQYRNTSLNFPPNIQSKIPIDILKKFYVIAVMRPSFVNGYNYFNSTPSFVIPADILKYKDGYFPMTRCYVNNITGTRPPPNSMVPITIIEFKTYQ